MCVSLSLNLSLTRSRLLLSGTRTRACWVSGSEREKEREKTREGGRKGRTGWSRGEEVERWTLNLLRTMLSLSHQSSPLPSLEPRGESWSRKNLIHQILHDMTRGLPREHLFCADPSKRRIKRARLQLRRGAGNVAHTGCSLTRCVQPSRVEISSNFHAMRRGLPQQQLICADSRWRSIS